LYPYPPFKQQVQTVLIEKVLAIFHKCPFFVITLKPLLISTIGDTGAAGRAELILTLCWIVGEYTNSLINPQCTAQVIHDYHEALELFNDERISVVRLGIKNIGTLSAEPGMSFAPHDPLANHALSSNNSAFADDDTAEHLSATNTARLMLVVINSLSKLASRCQDLAARVVMSLTKLAQHGQYFLPIVARRAEECIRILKFPSVASAILDAPQHCDSSDGRSSHIDQNSALHFILQPAASTQLLAEEAIPLHQFELQ
jgi:AP-5 complex subunit zeta-1